MTAPDAATVRDVVCGDAACDPSQLCFHLRSGGTDGECIATVDFDGGVCPAGWRLRTDGCHGPGTGCVPPRCSPRPALCGTVSPACQAHPGCDCFATDPCAPGGFCAAVIDGQVTCACP